MDGMAGTFNGIQTLSLITGRLWQKCNIRANSRKSASRPATRPLLSPGGPRRLGNSTKGTVGSSDRSERPELCQIAGAATILNRIRLATECVQVSDWPGVRRFRRMWQKSGSPPEPNACYTPHDQQLLKPCSPEESSGKPFGWTMFESTRQPSCFGSRGVARGRQSESNWRI